MSINTIKNYYTTVIESYPIKTTKKSINSFAFVIFNNLLQAIKKIIFNNNQSYSPLMTFNSPAILSYEIVKPVKKPTPDNPETIENIKPNSNPKDITLQYTPMHTPKISYPFVTSNFNFANLIKRYL